MMPSPIPSITEIEPCLFIGNLASSWHIDTLREKAITSLVSLTNERYSQWYRVPNEKQVPEDRRLCFPCLDTMTTDLLARMADICDFIDKQLAMSVPLLPATPLGPPNETENLEQHDVAQACPTTPGRVLVHCHAGISRSPAMVIAYLMRKRGETLDAVLADVKSKRRLIRPNKNFLEQLKVWEEVEYEVWLDKERKIPKEPYQAYLDLRASRLKELGLTEDESIGNTSL